MISKNKNGRSTEVDLPKNWRASFGIHILKSALFTAAAVLFLGSQFLQAEATKPNFVIILTDDQGYGDLGYYGSKDAITPRIDQMAAEGAKLTSFYMAGPYCTPPRAALMTGSYPKRIGMAAGVCLAADPKGLHPNEINQPPPRALP